MKTHMNDLGTEMIRVRETIRGIENIEAIAHWARQDSGTFKAKLSHHVALKLVYINICVGCSSVLVRTLFHTSIYLTSFHTSILPNQ